MPQLLKSIAVAACVGLLVSSCQTSVPTEKQPELTFNHLEPLKVNVASVEVKITYKATPGVNHVEERFPTSPAKAINRWIVDRVRPVGGPNSGKLRLVITDAGIIETALKQDKSITGTFTHQQTQSYAMIAGARVEVLGYNDVERAYSTAKAMRTFTTPDNLSLNEREKIWFDAMEKLMKGFNEEMEANMRQYLGSYMK